MGSAVLGAVVASVSGTYSDAVTTVFSSTIAAKVWFASAAVFFAIVQLLTATRMYGRLQRLIAAPVKVVARVHRWSGRIALLLTLPVMFHCVFILGFQTVTTRILIHSILGSFIYGVFAAKVVFLRDHSYPRYAIPVAGGVLFAVLALLWATSAGWYFTSVRVGF